MIYIDPPYGKDSIGQFAKTNYKNNITRDNLLSMLETRLKLARNLLSEEGVIFCSIDDKNQVYVKILFDKVFGEDNFIITMIRKTASNRAMAKLFNCLHEYWLLYYKNINQISIKGELKDLINYKNPDNDLNGNWTTGNPSILGSLNIFDIENPYTHKIDFPPKGRGWCFKKEDIKELICKGKLVFKKEYKNNQRGFYIKQYLKGQSKYHLVNSMFFAKNEFLNQVATKQDMTVFNDIIFNNPKPSIFIQYLVKFASHSNSIILDFFAGSGTTDKLF